MAGRGLYLLRTEPMGALLSPTFFFAASAYS
jgi:hypothetical protein